MAWVKLDDQLPLNTKMRALTIQGRYLYVTSLCWSAMQMNDGTFPASDIQSVAVLAGVPQNAAEQLSPHLWHREGFDCEACADVGQSMPVPSGHITIHCYLERNESRAQVEERRRKDRQRKARSTPDSARNPRGSPARIPPVSSRPVLKGSVQSSSSDSRANGERPDDDDLSTGDVPPETWDAYADLKLRAVGNVKNPGPWKTTTARNAKIEFADQAARWWHDFDLTPRRLAECLLDGQIRNVPRRPT